MNPATMMATPRSLTWRLASGEALRLPAVRRARWLQVQDGEVWLTLDGSPGAASEDNWLRAGSLWLLPPGREAVLEGHPQASFHLLEPARDGQGRRRSTVIANATASARALAQSWRGWVQRLALTPAANCGEPCP